MKYEKNMYTRKYFLYISVIKYKYKLHRLYKYIIVTTIKQTCLFSY